MDYNKIYSAVETAFENLSGSEKYEIEGGWYVAFSNGDEEHPKLWEWRIDLFKGDEYVESYYMENYFLFYVELLRGDNDIVGMISDCIWEKFNSFN